VAPLAMRRLPDVRLRPARAPQSQRNRPGAVYLLPHIGRTRFKVGWSLHPLLRVQQLPEYPARQLDLQAADVAWFEHATRAREVERALHRSLAPFQVRVGHFGDGRTEWFATQALALARRIVGVLPASDGASRRVSLRPLLDASEPPENFGALRHESALDAWYRVEDLWLRLERLLPLALHEEREQRRLHWIGLKRLVDVGHLVLRSRVIDIDTYGWREPQGRRTLVTLIDWEGDDLVLELMPARTLRRWDEGDQVDQLMAGFIAGHALSPALARAQAEVFHVGGQP
jgi:hypothetical protein